MPSVVACPKCKSKYTVPDKLLGRPVKCKSCATTFTAGGGKAHAPGQPSNKASSAQVARTKQQSAANQAQRRDLAKYGIDGPLNRQPDIFGSQATQPGMDPLANHVVHDPGFAEVEVAPVEVERMPTYGGDEALFNNPAVNAPKKKEEKEDPLAAYLPPVPEGEKRKVEPEESIGNAMLILVMVGLLTIGLNLYGYINAGYDVEDFFAAGSGNVDGEAFTRASKMSAFKLYYAIGIGVGVAFCVLGGLVSWFPVTCTSIGLALYVLMIVIFAISDPSSLLQKPFGKVAIIVGLITAIVDSVKHQYFKKKKRRKRNRS